MHHSLEFEKIATTMSKFEKSLIYETLFELDKKLDALEQERQELMVQKSAWTNFRLHKQPLLLNEPFQLECAIDKAIWILKIKITKAKNTKRKYDEKIFLSQPVESLDKLELCVRQQMILCGLYHEKDSILEKKYKQFKRKSKAIHLPLIRDIKLYDIDEKINEAEIVYHRLYNSYHGKLHAV